MMRELVLSLNISTSSTRRCKLQPEQQQQHTPLPGLFLFSPALAVFVVVVFGLLSFAVCKAKKKKIASKSLPEGACLPLFASNDDRVSECV
jgi:hypothetical protein